MEDRNGVYSNVGSSCGPTIYKLKWYWFWWWGENGVSDVEWCNVEINFTNYNTMYTIVKVCYFCISSPPCEEHFVASTATEFRTLDCAQCHVPLFLKFTFETGKYTFIMLCQRLLLRCFKNQSIDFFLEIYTYTAVKLQVRYIDDWILRSFIYISMT